MDSSIHLQKNIRNNSEELKDFIADLHRWEKDLKSEEEDTSHTIAPHQELPPVRCKPAADTVKKIVSSNKRKVADTNQKKTERISSYDYAAWDKFDVSKALESDEENNAKVKSVTHGMDSKEIKTSNLSKVEKASRLKDEGNKFYSSGRLDDAIAKYTQGMALDPSNAILPANRAMAYIKLEKYEAAEADCNRCLKLDANYIKGYLRRGSSRLKLGKTRLAADDFKRVLELEPWNKDAKKELEKLDPSIEKFSSPETEEEKNLKNVNIGRVDIKEISSQKTANSVQNSLVLEKNFQKVSAEERQNTSESLLKETKKEGGKMIVITEVDSSQPKSVEGETFEVVVPVNKPPHLRSQKPLRKISVVDVSSEDCIPLALVSSGAFAKDLHKTQPEKIHAEPISILCTAKAAASEQDCQKQAKGSQDLQKTVDYTDELKKTDITPSMVLPGIPRTSHHFSQDWHKLRNCRKLCVKYIKEIHPSFFRGIDLDVEIMVDLISALLWEEFMPSESLTYLEGLAQTNGFSVNLLFLDSTQQKVINQLIEKCIEFKSHTSLFEKIKASLL
ncbi:RNA polymerase II-associated protein 3 [Halocaridina rubra]|uniref:RNA polymerase II-associated protein 3 n=1 Tax=Halocaridina rubra TaxID=373956 RepID=A0AAN9A9X5_HALRR